MEGKRLERCGRALSGKAVHLFLICMLAASIVSCATTADRQGDRDGFDFVVDNFNNAVRWGEFQTASTYVEPTIQEDFWRIADALQNKVAITECEVKRSSFDEQRRRGEVTLVMRCHTPSNPKINTCTINEHWTFHEKEKVWRLVSHNLDVLER